jgi:uncharacterized membrane protein
MAMRPTRKIVAEFIGVFLVGALAGGLVTWSFEDNQLTSFMNRTNSPEALEARIEAKYQTQYNLTPDELNHIRPLILAMARHLYLVRHQFGIDILSTADNYHAQIAANLNPEHRAAYVAAMQARRKQLGTMLLPDPSQQSQGSN